MYMLVLTCFISHFSGDVILVVPLLLVPLSSSIKELLALDGLSGLRADELLSSVPVNILFTTGLRSLPVS